MPLEKGSFTELVPNLDAINDASTLDACYEHFRELEKACAALARYCERKETAIEYRKEGKIADAQRNESECDKIYSQLPDWAKSW